LRLTPERQISFAVFECLSRSQKQDPVFSRHQPIADSKIIQAITRRLANCGVRAPSRVLVACSGGRVTISGAIQYEHMRHPVLRAAQGVEGVRNVLDLLTRIAATPHR
jgi:osmotically-inducible protein OsmY